MISSYLILEETFDPSSQRSIDMHMGKTVGLIARRGSEEVLGLNVFNQFRISLVSSSKIGELFNLIPRVRVFQFRQVQGYHGFLFLWQLSRRHLQPGTGEVFVWKGSKLWDFGSQKLAKLIKIFSYHPHQRGSHIPKCKRFQSDPGWWRGIKTFSSRVHKPFEKNGGSETTPSLESPF